ncbi:XRE family transcriptional regulator [Kitasatospora sp. CM 4170]|uniref:XRE family transcriptional regulator n=1 Tax=Kitasatospora aburaviensis TaxID=67265 RepID=A0ABW1EZX8_9ACTN|nr:XRE family transcriptional regulator [Kitasatospora sp. CM 4170]WNM43540.1 XRE family transcriptional regulator [Kitasatospora sp. CM 4170]
MGVLIQLCDEAGIERPRLDADQLGHWETDRQPRARTIDLLCRLYRTDATTLGLAGDYRSDAEVISVPRHPGPGNRAEASVRPSTSEGLWQTWSDPLTSALDSTRRAVERTLAATTVGPTQLELLDERVMSLRHEYVFTPPMAMLGRLLADLEEIRLHAVERQPAGVQVRLSEMTAVVATLIADALMKLGRLDDSERWYGTARMAADDCGNVQIRARVRVQAAMLPYYYGPMERAAELARQARLLNRGRPTATGAFAAAAEARALARLGRTAEAHMAIGQAQALFEQCDQGDPEDAWAFPERRLFLYLSGAHTFLGETGQARAAQHRALGLYPDRTGIDPALLRLEEAICLIKERSLTEGCQLAGHTYLQVPEAHRTEILGSRARAVIDILPARVRSTRAVRELGEILALPSGTT